MNSENTQFKDSQEKQHETPPRLNLSEGVDQLEELDPDFNDRREKLHQITQRTRFTLLQNILMHPKQAPSLEELNYINPDKSRATIREHLENLIETGVIEKKVIDQSDASRGDPRSFYYLTSETRELLGQFGILEIEDTLQYLYSNTNKSEKVKRYEAAPRPE